MSSIKEHLVLVSPEVVKKKRKEKEKKKYFQGALGSFLLTFVVQLEIQKKKKKRKVGWRRRLGGRVNYLKQINK